MLLSPGYHKYHMLGYPRHEAVRSYLGNIHGNSET